jgi:hypothetical protein
MIIGIEWKMILIDVEFKIKTKNLWNSIEFLKEIHSQEKYNRVATISKKDIGNGLLCSVSILCRFLKIHLYLFYLYFSMKSFEKTSKINYV